MRKKVVKSLDDAKKYIGSMYPGETLVVIVGEKIAFVKIEHDSDSSNPLENSDENGTLHSFNRNHTTFLDPNGEEFERLREEFAEDMIPLSYYEHGNSLWMVAGGDTPAGVEFQWDGVRFAGVWTPDGPREHGLRDYADQEGERRGSPERLKRMREYAKQACELYTTWANGEVYGYEIDVFDLDLDDDEEPWDDEDDYRRDDPIEQDACWGFYGHDSVVEAVRESLDGLLSEPAKETA